MVDPSEREGGARTALLDAAERLFAERGIAAVSLREVGAAARQRNNSAAQYHFGSRQGLVEAIVAARSVPIDHRRGELLLALPARPALEELLHVVIAPLAETAGAPHGARYYLRFLAQVLRDPVVQDAWGSTPPPPSLDAVSRQARALLPGLSTPVFARRMSWGMLLALECLADHERHAALQDAPTSGEVVAELVHTVAALLRAPSPRDLDRRAGVP